MALLVPVHWGRWMQAVIAGCVWNVTRVLKVGDGTKLGQVKELGGERGQQLEHVYVYGGVC